MKQVIEEDKEDLLTHLAIIVNILNQHKINFWMYGGALLGYVRNGDLISWDRDIDLFVWKDDYQKVRMLKKEIEKKGFKYLFKERTTRLVWDSKEITIGYYELKGDYAIRTKLVTNNKFGNMIYFGLLSRTIKFNMKKTYRFLRWFLLKSKACYEVRQIVPAHFYLELKEINLFNIILKVPAETEEYLEYTFGKDWRMPKKDFKYTPEYIQIIAGKKKQR
jgi:hypothetical protein